MTVLACFLAVACSGGVSTVSGPEGDDGGGSVSVSSVQMTPSDLAVGVDGQANLSLEITTEDGEPLDRDGEWAVEDSSVVEVQGEGAQRQVTGLAEGSTSVIGIVDGVADTALVEVTSPTSEPVDGEPAVVFDPDKYSSTQELMDDPYGVFGGSEIGGNIHLDDNVGYPGGSKSMRYDWVDQGPENAIGIGRRIPLPSNAEEVWVEFEVRWSRNFMDIENTLDEPGWTYSYKLFFFQVIAPGGENNWTTSDGQKVSRWAINWPGGGWSDPPNGPVRLGSPRTSDGDSGVGVLGEVDGVNVADFFDEEWHTVRWHVRHDPGLSELWIDGELVQRVDGFTIHPEIVTTAILLGRNKDDGIESGTESLWWGKVSIWTEPPGW